MTLLGRNRASGEDGQTVQETEGTEVGRGVRLPWRTEMKETDDQNLGGKAEMRGIQITPHATKMRRLEVKRCKAGGCHIQPGETWDFIRLDTWVNMSKKTSTPVLHLNTGTALHGLK